MIPVPSPVEGLRIERDVRSGTWRLHAGDSAATVRAWTWGERRRLLQAVTAGGAFDRALFVAGLLDLVVEGSLAEIDPDTVALTCLHLFGVPEHDPVLPLTRAELAAATTFGWTPQQLEAHPATDIDRLLGALQQPAADDGWTHIVVVPAATAMEARLGLMLRTVAQWAGVGEIAGATDSATNRQRGPAVRSESPAPHTSASPPAGGVMQVSPQDGEAPFDRTIAGTARLRRRPAIRRADALADAALVDDLVDAALRPVPPVHPIPPEGTADRDGRLPEARDSVATAGRRVSGPAAPANEPGARRVRPAPILPTRTDAAGPPAPLAAGAGAPGPVVDGSNGLRSLPAIARVQARSLAARLRAGGQAEPPVSDADRRDAQLAGASTAAGTVGQSARGPARRAPVPPGPMLSTAVRDADVPWSAESPDAPVPVLPNGARQSLGESDFFPTFRARVQWPDVATAASHERHDRRDAPVVPADPFAASDLEERIADLLDRAAREGGIDLP